MGIWVYEKCEECGTPFAKRRGNLKKHCSKECRNAARRKKRPTYTMCCAYPKCNTEFITKRKEQKYCNKDCKKLHEAEEFQKTLKKSKRVCAYELCDKSFLANRKTRYCCKEHAQAQKLINDRRRYDEGKN